MKNSNRILGFKSFTQGHRHVNPESIMQRLRIAYDKKGKDKDVTYAGADSEAYNFFVSNVDEDDIITGELTLKNPEAFGDYVTIDEVDVNDPAIETAYGIKLEGGPEKVLHIKIAKKNPSGVFKN